ncbi:MAG: Asp23/Gls24 family envelope stress response protein [bacterium]|nr:Asp23/Gls24 family envelope stress response protein [bacterium]
MTSSGQASKEWGDIGVSNEVFESIALICTQKIAGVVGIESSEGLVDSLSKVWGRGEAARGVKVTTIEDDVAIDMTVIMKEGFPIPQVAEHIQREVKSVVEEMTGQSVQSVNILVADLQPAAAEAELIPPS